MVGKPRRVDSLESSLLSWRSLAKPTSLKDIYDAAWSAFADLEVYGEINGSDILQEFEQTSRVFDEKFLLDVRNATGQLLIQYVGCQTKASWFQRDKAQAVLKEVKKLRWHDYDGEVLYSYYLLSNSLHLGQEDSELLLGKASAYLHDFLLSYESHAREIRDVAFSILLLSTASQTTSKQSIQLLASSGVILSEAARSAQLEPLSILLWAFERLKEQHVEYRTFLDNYIEMLSTRIDAQLQELSSLIADKDAFDQILDAISLAKEGLGEVAKAKYGNVVKSSDSNHLELNLSNMNPALPMLSVLSKTLIALSVSGLLRPFKLSRREYSIYKIIKDWRDASRKPIRVYELFTGLFAMGSLVMLLLYGLLAYLGQLKSLYTVEILALLIYSYFATAVWKEGALNRESLKDVVKGIWTAITRT
ncbi:MAG: hypothetical protein JRN68_07705 [Nitrososphaerota archaeon]|nr:hypothetical protein [Nitrososphaerota archaeon]